VFPRAKAALLSFTDLFVGFYSYFGGLVLLALQVVGQCGSIARSWRDVGRTVGRTMGQLANMGASALLINNLIIALIAFSISFSSSVLLRRYGAGIFLADILAIGLCEHLVPILTGIVVAGRSGSRVAAEIGTMQVTDEITAMTTMAMNPIKLLVIPRMLAMTIAIPFLTVVGDIVGLLVGGLVAKTYLGLSLYDYQRRLLEVLSRDPYFQQGMYKAFVFGMIVALVSCYRGFQVRGGPSAVGQATTNSVVDSIIFIVGINTVFTTIRSLTTF